jgi:kynureninase
MIGTHHVSPYDFPEGMAGAERLDAADTLSSYRARFHLPRDSHGRLLIYLCGNSLGLQPRTVRTYIEQELKDWELLGVEGHMHAVNPWMPYNELLTGQTADLVGARPSEVVVMNSLTVNLHLMMVSFFRPTAVRHKIVIEQHAFPSDRYAIQSQLRFHGFDPATSLIQISPRAGEDSLRTEDILNLLENEGERIALVMLGGVNYYTGQFFEMERITAAAQVQGCMVGFDLAHAIGNVPLKLHEWNVDFAVWCSYKYLNGGPGSIAGCFVHERHAQRTELPRFVGWWGNEKSTRFEMKPDVQLIHGAEGWQLSNPPIFQMAALRASMEIFHDVGMQRLRTKSVLLTAYMEYLLGQLPPGKVAMITPQDPKHRGAQLSLRVPRQGKVLHSQLTAQGVMCDWREPDVIRFAPVPLYNSFRDVFMSVDILKEA